MAVTRSEAGVGSGGGDAYTWDELTHLTSSAPRFLSLVDPPMLPEFLTPGDMPERIRAYCPKTGRPVPETRGAVLRRYVQEALALKHRFVLDLLEELTGQPLDVLHMAGGG